MGANACIRAFADDIGIVIKDFRVAISIIAALFQQFGRISGLILNLRKTQVIPLFDWSARDIIMDILAMLDDRWSQVEVVRHGKYLGVFLGPGGEDTMWAKVLLKMSRGACEWAAAETGASYAVLAMNVYIASKMSYIAQCFNPSAKLKADFGKVINLMFPGPGNWISHSVFYCLKELGFDNEVMDPSILVESIMFRCLSKMSVDVVKLGAEAYLRRRALRCKFMEADRTFVSWCGGGIAIAWWECLTRCRKKGLCDGALNAKAGFQQICFNKLLNKEQRKSETLRLIGGKLDLLKIEPDTCSEMLATRLAANIKAINKVKPAFAFAFLRLASNGWVTYDRMKHCENFDGTPECKFCNAMGCDSIQHFAGCSVIIEAYSRCSNGAVLSGGLRQLLCLGGMESVEGVRFSGRFVYAVYMVFNRLRDQGTTSQLPPPQPVEDHVDSINKPSTKAHPLNALHPTKAQKLP
jgi:hypothetical protein